MGLINWRVILLGVMLGMAIALMQAGVAQILLAQNQDCALAAERMRLSDPSRLSCMPEFAVAVLESVATGFLPVINPGSSFMLSVVAMTLVLGVLGGFFAQFYDRWAVGFFVAIDVLFIFFLATMRYLSNYLQV